MSKKNRSNASTAITPGKYGFWYIVNNNMVRVPIHESLFQEQGVDLPEEVQKFFEVDAAAKSNKEFPCTISLTYGESVFLNASIESKSGSADGVTFSLNADSKEILQNSTHNILEFSRTERNPAKKGKKTTSDSPTFNYKLLLAYDKNLPKPDILIIEDPEPEEYTREVTADELYYLFQDEKTIHREWVESLYDLYRMPGKVASCKQLKGRYRKTVRHYLSSFSKIAINTIDAIDCKSPEKDGTPKYWPVLFDREKMITDAEAVYVYRLKDPTREAVEMLERDGFFVKETDNMVHFDHNLILYGPPGTGKTYHSVIYAVAICEGKTVSELEKEPYDEILLRYHALEKAGRVAFTTFHQSYGYEEFIEGIRPVLSNREGSHHQNRDLQYVIRDGIFKSLCQRAKADREGKIPYDEDTEVWLVWLEDDSTSVGKKACFNDDALRFKGASDALDKNDPNETKYKDLEKMKKGDIVLSFVGIDGKFDNVGIVKDKYPEYYEEIDNNCAFWERQIKWNNEHIYFVLEALLGLKAISRRRGIQRIVGISTSDIVDTIEKALEKASEKASVTVPGKIEEETNRYILIIDEINRGNISKIFGELITLIEETKREGAREEMKAILPYSGESFSVPDNVYLLGTMNTADRSIALMDTALRRRFSFIEMMPNPDILVKMGVGSVNIEGQSLNVARMLEVINDRIEYLFDREHTIGHAFFTRLANDPSIETLSGIFEKNVIPLLQEYFYEDYEKIQLVLGDNDKPDEYKFVKDSPVKERDLFKGNTDLGLSEKKFEIQRDAFLKIESYKRIGRGI